MPSPLPALCPFQGQIPQVKFQTVKSSIPLTDGPANRQGGWSLIDLMNHTDKSPFVLPKTCLSTELCDCLFGVQDCHISSSFHIIIKTLRNSYDQSVPQKIHREQW